MSTEYNVKKWLEFSQVSMVKTDFNNTNMFYAKYSIAKSLKTKKKKSLKFAWKEVWISIQLVFINNKKKKH